MSTEQTAWLLQTWSHDPDKPYSWLVNTRLFTSKAAALLWAHENLSGANTPAKWDLWLQRYTK